MAREATLWYCKHCGKRLERMTLWTCPEDDETLRRGFTLHMDHPHEPVTVDKDDEALRAFRQCETVYLHPVSDDEQERAAIAGFWNARNAIPVLLAKIARLQADASERIGGV